MLKPTLAVHRFRVPALLLLAQLGCTSIKGSDGQHTPVDQQATEGAAGQATSPPAVTGNMPGTEPPPEEASAGPMAFLRLTREQYQNTVFDLLGVPDAASALPPNGKNEAGFAASGAASNVEVNAWALAAESIAKAVQSKWGTLVPCNIQGDDAACANLFVQGMGRRVFRRPVLPEEAADLAALYQRGRTEMNLDHSGGLGLLLEAMLQSPSFLYRWELGPRSVTATNARGVIRLGGHELASRLSYFLWNSMPDPALSSAADAGKLTDVVELDAHARRLLMNPTKTKQALDSFALSWLQVADLEAASKNSTRFPEFTTELKVAMAREASEFFSGVVLHEDAKLETLLLAPYTFLNAPLAAVYGISGVTGGDFRKVSTVAGQRAGVLTLPGLLAHGAGPAFPSPTKRGELIRTRILCQPVPPPPPTVQTNLPPPATEAPSSIREQYEQHALDPQCAACHSLIDPLGFGFLRYDAIGRWNSAPVDTTGTLVGAGTSDGVFSDGLDLARRLSESAEVRSCMVRQMLRFAIGRKESGADDAAVAQVLASFNSSGHDVRELMLAIVSSPSFLYRATPEVMP